MRNILPVKVGGLKLDGEKIYLQSMLSVRADDILGNVKQAVELEKCGCEILRVAIPDEEALKLIPAIKNEISIPLVADIHFDYKLAVKSAELGIDKIRINPGNIGSDSNVLAVVNACKEKNIPIRIGVNSGSLDKEILEKYSKVTPQALVESALKHVRILEKFDFYNTVISIKSSNVADMIRSYEILSESCNYPLHLGVTEAGTEKMGIIKSSIGIGALLAKGIGETIRVSLTADPKLEISAGKDILKALGKTAGVQIVSCPTCGRTKINLEKLAKEVESATADIKKNMTIAVMGCVVNGPGEAREADFGIAGGDGVGIIFKKGVVIKKVSEENLLCELLAEVEKFEEET